VRSRIAKRRTKRVLARLFLTRAAHAMPRGVIMSRHRSIAIATAFVVVPSCHVDRDPGSAGSLATTAADADTSTGESSGPRSEASDDGAADTSTAPPASDDAGSSEAGDDASSAASDGGPDPTGDGDSSEPHGEGMCGGGFGATNDLAHVPLCPSDPATLHERFNATRGNYYHDGDHVFEPGVVQWDDTLAIAAQEYAEAYAAGMPPDGMEYYTPAYVYDPYWDGQWEGYRAIAGMETPTSCTCTMPDPIFGMSESYVFYNAASAYFRANVVRIDGMSRMGIGHVAPGDGSHYWTLLFAE
jgi:hypothetical protein